MAKPKTKRYFAFSLMLIFLLTSLVNYHIFALPPSVSGSWADYAAETFDGGSGLSDDPYQIKTAAQLSRLAALVNAGSEDASNGGARYADLCYIMTGNIELAAHYWVPIGSASQPFNGMFVGDGYAVSNLKIGSAGSPETAYPDAGLFGCASGMISNLTLIDAGVYVSGGGSEIHAGTVVGSLKGGMLGGVSATGVCVSGPVSEGFYGGLTAYASGRSFIYSCSVSGGSVSGRYAGGLAGKITEETVVNGCNAGCAVTGFMAGGLVGCGNQSTILTCDVYSWSTVTGVVPSDTIPGDRDYSFAGGIIAESIIMTVTNDRSAATVAGTYAGGLIGDAELGFVSGCSFTTGTVTSNASKTSDGLSAGGGLIGWAIKKDTQTVGCVVRNCYSTGDVSLSGTGYYAFNGGLIGYVTDGEIADCFSESATVGAANWAGGLIGYTKRTGVRECSASNTVTSGYYAGGLVGQADTDSAIANCDVSGAIAGSTGWAGGIAAEADGASIKNSFYIGSINYYWNGAIVANAVNTVIDSAYYPNTMPRPVWQTSGGSLSATPSTTASLQSDSFKNTLNSYSDTNFGTQPWERDSAYPFLDPIANPPLNASPVITDLKIENASGSALTQAAPGQTITAAYDYHDDDSDPEGASVFYWFYVDDDVYYANLTRIGGATEASVTVPAAALGKYIGCQVIPLAQCGDARGYENYTDPIPVALGTVSAGKSLVETSAASVQANATAGATITVTLKDEFGNAIPGKTVSLSQGSGSSSVTAVNAVTDENGRAQFTVTNTTAETVTYAAKDASDDIAITDTAEVLFFTVAAPASSVPSGEVNNGDEITLSSGTPGALIYFTTDGSVPTTASTPYTGPIKIDKAVTIKAIAVKDGVAVSGVSEYVFTVPPAPYTGFAPATQAAVFAAASLIAASATLAIRKKERKEK